MEVNLTVDEDLIWLIANSTKKEINLAMTEALNQWVERNLPRCPFDEKYCASTKQCNSCSRFEIKRIRENGKKKISN